jgi:two-component system, response regulator
MHKPQAIQILLVEDNDYDAELTLRALKQNHLANLIHRVADGQEALDYLFPPESSTGLEENGLPKLIFLDLKLPRISGLEVLKKIKSETQTKLIPVVVLSSSTQEKDIIESYGLGVNSYIVKPVEFDKFVEAVQSIGLYWLLLNQLPSD